MGEGMEDSTLIGTSLFMGKEEAACVCVSKAKNVLVV